MFCWLVCMQKYHCRNHPVPVQSTTLLHERSGLLMYTLHYLTIYRYTYTSLFPSQSVPVSLRKWHVWRDLQIAGLRTELIRTQTHSHTQTHNRGGQSGDWTQGLPHAERVWYHYTNCPCVQRWEFKLIPSNTGWGLFLFAPFPFNALREGLQQVRFSHFAFLSLPFSLVFGVTCFCTSSCHGSRTASLSLKYPIGTSKMGAPSSCHTAFWYHQERKQSDTKKKERKQRHTKKQRKMIKKKCKVTQERKQSDTKKKAKWHQARKQSDTKKEAKWPRRKVKWHLCFFFLVPGCFLSWLLSFLVSLCFLVADREPNAASWCPFAFFLGVTFLSFGVSRFYLGVASASFLPPRCLLSWCHVGFFLGVTLLSFLGSHFFFLLPFFAFNY